MSRKLTDVYFRELCPKSGTSMSFYNSPEFLYIYVENTLTGCTNFGIFIQKLSEDLLLVNTPSIPLQTPVCR